jgi:PAS domain S-box-containing protein
MPYRVRIAEGGERIDTPDDSDWAVLDLTRSTPGGIVRFYRGILNVTEMQMTTGTPEKATIGKVIIDLPFFFENLELAARTGPRTPEVLRNIQQGTVAPRVEEPEALLLARVDGTRIYESSSEKLPVGTRISPDIFERAREERWPVLATEGGTYRIIAYPMDDGSTWLVAGFAAASLKRHLLRWSTLFSLYLFFAFLMIVITVLLASVPRLQPVLPTLTPGRRLGFQQKLLASFLLVALVPAIILGVFAVDFIRDRFVDENRQEALDKAFSARKAFVNLLHGELQFFLDEVDIAELFNPEAPATQAVGTDRLARRFIDTADLLQYGPPRFPVAGALHEASTEDLFIVREGNAHYIGVVSASLQVSGGDWSGVFYVYYARRVDGALLSEIAEQVGADVNIYDEGALVASSREGLLAGGFISAIMNAGAFVKVSMLGSGNALATEQAGSYRYQVAYLPVTNWGDGSIFRSVLDPERETETVATPDRAAISVPLVFRPESYYAEVQKATSLILGIFALLFTATIALGLILARGIFEPLRALLAGTRRIAEGDFTAQVALRRSDEIGTVVSAFNEMTERIAASQRVLEERRRYLETILQNIGTGVISTDGDDRIRNFNRAAERILGMSARDAVGRTPAELTAGGATGAVFALLAGGSRDENRAARRFVSDEVVLERDSGKMTVRYMLTRLEHDTRYLGTVFVFEDLTELIQSKKLSAWVEMARQIAHEIKNPLTPIRISTQFMQRAYETRPEQFDKIFREGTETIMHQVDVLKRIASEFSSYGRMQQLEVGPHPLEPILRGIVTPYQKNDAGVRVHYENGVPDATVLLDPEAVRKICANLIENALEAMPDGGDLRVSCEETRASGAGFVRIAFEDNGAGLSSEVADRLFEPYFSTKTTGTGLGLAICRTLAHEMGGEVTVQNRPGERGVEAALTLRVDRS